MTMAPGSVGGKVDAVRASTRAKSLSLKARAEADGEDQAAIAAAVRSEVPTPEGCHKGQLAGLVGGGEEDVGQVNAYCSAGGCYYPEGKRTPPVRRGKRPRKGAAARIILQVVHIHIRAGSIARGN